MEQRELEQEVEAFRRKWRSSTESITAFTSGSTGDPKPIRLRKQYMRASAEATIHYLDLQPGHRALLALSPRYIAGMMMLVRAEVGGLELHLSPPAAQPIPPAETFDLAALVPYQAAHSRLQLSQIKNLLIGGGPLSASLEHDLRKHPGAVYHTYGMTETITHVALRQINRPEGAHYFTAMPGVQFKVDSRQCLIIDAPLLGVKELRTHDVVEWLSPERFRWLGRIDHVVNSGGLKLFPERLEQELGVLSRPYFFAGIPHPQLGQQLILVAEAPSQAGRELAREVRLATASWPAFHRPKQIWHASGFSYTTSGKIRRAASLAVAKPYKV